MNVFKLSLLIFVRPVANSVFEISNPYGLKLLARLRLGLSHLRYHKFRHNFQLCINPICVCGLEIETTTHFLLRCPIFQCARQSLLTNIKEIDESILKTHDELITKTRWMVTTNLTCLVISLEYLQQLFLQKDLVIH